MKNVLIYTKDYCPYCIKAKALLESLGQTYTEVDLVQHPDKKAEMVQKANGRTTVPQIFIEEQHIGGCDDLHALHNSGELKALLG